MTKNRIVLFLGIFLFLIPFMGFPTTWETFFDFVFGLILIAVSVSSTIKRRVAVRKPRRKKANDIALEEITTNVSNEQIETADQ